MERLRITVKKSWFESPMDYFVKMKDIPFVVKKSMDNLASHKRKTNCRIWINPKKNFMPFHYDGNALFVFTVQVTGKKRWVIVSPNTPLPCYAFSRMPYLKYNKTAIFDKNYHVYDFELDTGEMLFLPPFWAHQVTAMADENINISWVATKIKMQDTCAFEREKEILKCAFLLLGVPLISNFIQFSLSDAGKHYLENYGGVKEVFLKEIIDGVSRLQVIKRFFLELCKIPAGLKDSKALKEILGKNHPLELLERLD